MLAAILHLAKLAGYYYHGKHHYSVHVLIHIGPKFAIMFAYP